MSNKPEESLIAELAVELGAAPDVVAKVVKRHIKAGDLVLTHREDALSRGKAGAGAVTRLLDGQLAPVEAPQAVGATLGGVCHVLDAHEIPADRVPARPREKGLPEGLRAMADATEAEPTRLSITGSDPAKHRVRAGRITLLRSTLAELLVHADLLLDNLAVEERGAADDLLAQYRLVRTAAQSNRRLGDLLGSVEDYLFGAQKLGAENRAAGLARAATLTEKATRAARSSADSTARKEIADNLGAVLESFVSRPSDDKPAGR